MAEVFTSRIRNELRSNIHKGNGLLSNRNLYFPSEARSASSVILISVISEKIYTIELIPSSCNKLVYVPSIQMYCPSFVFKRCVFLTELPGEAINLEKNAMSSLRSEG